MNGYIKDFLLLFTDNLVNLVPFAVLCGYPFRDHFRFSLKKTIAATLALIMGAACAEGVAGVWFKAVLPYDNTLYTAINILFILLLIPCFFWYLYAIRDIWQKKAFVFLFALTAALLTVSICNCVLNALPGGGDWFPANVWTISSALITNGALIPLMCLFLKRLYLPVSEGLEPKETGYIIVPLAVLFVMYAAMFTVVDFAFLINNLTALLLYFGLLVTVFFLYGVIFKMHYIALQRHIANEKYMRAQYRADIRDEQYRRISDSIDSVKKQRHDLRHHLITLKGLLEGNESEKALQYVNLCLDRSDEIKITQFCGVPVINMLLSHYSGAAKEKGIDFSARVSVPDNISIDTADLSVILGNILENAAEAAETADDKQIRVNMRCRGMMLAITVDNTFDGRIRQENGEYLSAKGKYRGVGLKSIRDTAEKHGGGAEFGHSGNMFYSSVMLRINEE